MIRKPGAARPATEKIPDEVILTPAQNNTCSTQPGHLSLLYPRNRTHHIGRVRNTRLFNCGRGLAIALFGIKKERRLSLESYIGYMAFKNNIPVAYGGGWILVNAARSG